MNFRDLRNEETVARFAQKLEESAAPSSQNQFLATAWQVAGLHRTAAAGVQGARIAVTVPDFLTYARLINTGQAAQVVRQAGMNARTALAGLRALPGVAAHPLRALKMDFWLFAKAMLQYDLALLPASFNGMVMLHPYLADFAFTLERRNFLQAFFHAAGKRPAGIHTQQLPAAVSCCARWNLQSRAIAFLASAGASDDFLALKAARENPRFKECEFIADVSSLPTQMQDEEQLTAQFPAEIRNWIFAALIRS